MIDMSILSWILLGLIAGFLGSKIVNRHGEGIFLDIVLGIFGAVAGGYLFSYFGASRVSGLNLYSVLVATAGAVVVLVVYITVFDDLRSNAVSKSLQAIVRSALSPTPRHRLIVTISSSE